MKLKAVGAAVVATVVAAVWLALPSSPQFSFDAAYQAAKSGDTISVPAGIYPMSDPNEGATKINPSGSKSVTFTCTDTVQVDARNMVFAPGLSNVTFRGSCFRFHVVHFGYGGYDQQTHDITLDGVHMDSFECSGCANVTIKNSDIGPAVGCFAPSANVAASAKCDPAKPDEAFWATQPNGSLNEQVEPFIHNGGAGFARNILLEGNRIHGMQAKDASVFHTGGLLLWNIDGLTIRGNTFDNNAVYDILSESNSGSNGDTENNVVIENNVFGPPVQPIDGRSNGGQETPDDWRELNVGKFATTMTNWTIRNNTFKHGMSLASQPMSNVTVANNKLGSNSFCGTGPAYTGNAGGGTPCGDTAPPPPPPPVNLREQAYQAFKFAMGQATLVTTWRKFNPGEASRLDTYIAALDAGATPSPPTMTTATGRMLVTGIHERFVE